jgi:hypothetical protein
LFKTAGPVATAAMQAIEQRIHQVEQEFADFVRKEEARAEQQILLIQNQLERTKAAGLLEHVERVFKG